ncbi:MAG: peptidase M4 family protein [Labilithrix sp.]|nr:peptidase M4 family protein [Labilithrix sp.]
MKKLAFLALSIVAAAGCSTSSDSQDGSKPSPIPTDVTQAQLHAFAELEASTQQAWTWKQHEELATPMHLSTARTGKPVLAKGGDAVKATLSVLAEHKALFKMRDPGLELAVARSEVDELGMTHARFQQVVHGVPVAGAELMAHYDQAGRLTSIDANYVADLHGVDVNPVFAVSDALTMVKADIVSRSAVNEASLETEEQKLVVYASNENLAAPKLAYQYKVRAMTAEEPAIWVITVDAKTGEILHRYNNLQTIQGQGNGVLGDMKQFEVSTGNGGFVMTDAANGAQVRTLTAAQQQVRGTAVTSDTQNSWDTGVPGAGAAVDAHFNAAAVYKYYKEKHGRNSIDGNGGALISTVHFGRAYDNAAWDSTGMLYGDGGQMFRALSVSLDVVGHEFTHGVIEKTSNLVYENQPGALNEAVADIFGAFIEHEFKPDPVNNWKLGEAVVKSGGPLRDMKNPSGVSQAQPAHMNRFVNTQQDNGGVHINSGIINNAAFLMTVGGVNPVSKVEVKYGIGWEKSEKLWYRANAKYFLQSTNFGQAAQGLLQAAKDVGLTENETNIVDCALKATGIAQGTCAGLVDPQSGTPGMPGSDDSDDGTGASPGSEDGTGDDGEVDEETTAKPKKRRRMVTQTTSGCNAAGGGADLGGTVAMIAVALGLSVTRRKKR